MVPVAVIEEEAWLNVKVTAALVAEAYDASAAIVAITKQVPELDAEIVAEAEVLDNAQEVAVPPDVMAKVFAPLPFDPEVVIFNA